jgi:hypothetical protein
MKLATLLIITLSNQGYWLGGQTGTISFEPAVPRSLPAATISWQLLFDPVSLANGTQAIGPAVGANDGSLVLRLAPPTVRTRIEVRFVYRVNARDTGKEMASGAVPIHLFPPDLLHGLDRRLGKKRLLVLDRPAGLPKLFDEAHVPYSSISGAGQLLNRRPDIVLVGPEMLQSDLFDQMPLMALARSGASVMIFRQTRCAMLAGHPVIERRPPGRVQWREAHPLLLDFEPEDLQSWVDPDAEQHPIRIERDEPVLKIGCDPSEVGESHAESFDVVLLTQTIGRGRIVLCQVPLGDWGSDPRSQLLLRNAVDYLLMPPQPTLPFENPPPSELTKKRTTISTIPVSPGGVP